MDMQNFTLTKHDPRLVELIAVTNQKTLAIWAIKCLENGRHLFNPNYPQNQVIDQGIATLKCWIDGKITMWEARKYCWEILSQARLIEPFDKAACQILRACSHMLATCHVPRHAEGAAMYVIAAIKTSYKDQDNCIKMMEDERNWQIAALLNLINNK